MSAQPDHLNFNMPPRIQPDMILAVIPTLNEQNYIEACIRSLMQGRPGTLDIPLIVADGGSTDRTLQIVEQLQNEFPNIQIMDNPGRLQSAALNLAASERKSAQTKYLVRCDAHAIYPDDFIMEVATSLQLTKASSVVIPMDAVGRTCFEKANAWIVDTPLGSGGAVHRGGRKSGYVDHGHHAGFELETFLSLGGYDETFSHNEDAEYDQRLVDSGGKVFLNADIRIQYIPRRNAWRLARQYFSYGRGRARNAKKHGQRLKIRQMIPILALLGSISGLLLAPLFWPALLIPAGYTFILFAASLYILMKQRSVCGLLAGPASGIMHLSWAAGFLRQALFSKTGRTP